jgi:hypothetical protein
MSEGTRILWRYAIDAGSRALQKTDLAPALQEFVKDLQAEDCNDPGKHVAQLRFTKRIRPPPIIKSLRQLLETGRIQRAWVERSDGEERVQLANEQWIQLEPVVWRQKKKGTPAGAKKQRKAVSEEEQEEEEEVTGEEHEEELEEEKGDDEDNDEDGDHAEDTHCGIDVILSTINRLERQQRDAASTLRDLKRKIGMLKKNKRAGAMDGEMAGEEEEPLSPEVEKIIPPDLVKKRQPVHLKWLRRATVTELYYAGVWFPNCDVDESVKPHPLREACFRSELKDDTDYIENYDIDDILHYNRTNPYLKDKNDALTRTGYYHFVDEKYRGRVSLHVMRKASYDILHMLDVFHLDYDIDDENDKVKWSKAMPPRGRVEYKEAHKKHGYGGTDSLKGEHFIKGYDIDNTKKEEELQIARGFAEQWYEDRAARHGLPSPNAKYL